MRPLCDGEGGAMAGTPCQIGVFAAVLTGKNLDGRPWPPYTSAAPIKDSEFDPRGAEGGCQSSGMQEDF
jgi:hypothetical protein